MKKIMLGICRMSLAISLCLLMMCVNAYAGLNENAESIVAAASGTFEYNGKYYKATQGALSGLREKLDGKDITVQQAAQAIGMIKQNVAKGVEQGLLVETGDVEESTEQDERTDDPVAAEEQSQNGETVLESSVNEMTTTYKETQNETNIQPHTETQTVQDNSETKKAQLTSGNRTENITENKKYHHLPAIAGMGVCIAVIILMLYRIRMLKNR